MGHIYLFPVTTLVTLNAALAKLISRDNRVEGLDNSSYCEERQRRALRCKITSELQKCGKVPAFLNVVDIAGLVKGASEGQGLGNAFLSHISACDAIFHLCRAFEDDDVTHVEGEVDPVRDLEIINEELRLKDEETLTKALDKIGRVVERGADKKLKPEYDTLQKVKQVLCEEKNHIRFSDWDAKDIEILNKYLFLTSKPALYLVNLAEKDYIKKKNKWLIKIKEWVDKHDPGALIIPFSGAFEHKLVEEFEDPVLRKKFLEDNNVTRKAVGSLLYLMTGIRPGIPFAVGIVSRSLEEPQVQNNWQIC
ncbi:hypothetical protein HHI36_007435 [Cryptolaemus montrouzieri]|uniref:OBG-type G domain-containing protein n=1 Tax=Cryptolaemus montrouzieri TaxID=559131 RepID=A0ABD2MPT2_9CUCU